MLGDPHLSSDQRQVARGLLTRAIGEDEPEIRQLTAEEKAARNLPAHAEYQINRKTGQVTAIGGTTAREREVALSPSQVNDIRRLVTNPTTRETDETMATEIQAEVELVMRSEGMTYAEAKADVVSRLEREPRIERRGLFGLGGSEEVPDPTGRVMGIRPRDDDQLPEGGSAAPPPPPEPERLRGSAPAGELPRPQSLADFERLPSGTRFIAPDGSVRVKP